MKATSYSEFANIAKQLSDIGLMVDKVVSGPDSKGREYIKVVGGLDNEIGYHIALESTGMVTVTGTGIRSVWYLQPNQKYIAENIDTALCGSGFVRAWIRTS